MSLEESVTKSPLDKPLHQLTEEDISQLTREDCRRYLKDKGMRRPSWNKSQAIQQVISLKALFETTSDSDASAARKKLHLPRPDTHLHCDPKGANADAEIPVSVEDSVPYELNDRVNADRPGDLSSPPMAADNDYASARPTSAASESVGQMTIFYCGKVNVYDDVPADKAREIMQIAASPLYVSQAGVFNGFMGVQPPPCHLQVANVKMGSDAAMLTALQTVKVADNSWLQKEEKTTYREDNAGEAPGSRKASVQRYLEKRKDRFKSKKKIGIPSPTRLDMYLSQQMGTQMSSDHLSRSETCSPPQNISPSTPTRCSSLENNMARHINQSAGLSNRDIQE